MSNSISRQEYDLGVISSPVLTALVPIFALAEENEAEALRFLSVRPIHTVYMASLITDNGVVSPFNRGSFYGYRNDDGCLKGVALIGHATIIETETQECIQAFARIAKNFSLSHLIRGEQGTVESFWKYYSEGEWRARLISREFLLQCETVPKVLEALPGLRPATLAELDLIVSVNASMACEESGINPLARDRKGFRDRVARRIRQGRYWVLIRNDRLIFKTDIIAQTRQAAYLEGIFVDPEERGKGYGLRCLSQLTESLLTRTGSVCLTVNEKSADVLTFYKRAGFEIASRYDTIYLQS